MEKELSDEEVEQIVRLGNYLEVPGLARAVQGQELLSVKKVLEFQPEAKRINTVLQMMKGWKLSGLLLFREGRALALIVRSSDELPFAETFPHTDYAMAVEYVEGVAELLVATIEEGARTKPQPSSAHDENTTESTPTISELVDGAPTEGELPRASDVPTDELAPPRSRTPDENTEDSTPTISGTAGSMNAESDLAQTPDMSADLHGNGAFPTEAALEPQSEEIDQGPELNSAGPSELSLRVDELESRLQIDRDVVEQKLPSLAATTPTAPALVQRRDGTSRPLTLPPTEKLRAPSAPIEHRPHEFISQVVMVDPLQKRARLQNGYTVFVREGIERLEVHKRIAFKTIAPAREERFTVFPVEVVQELEDDLLGQAQ